MTIIGEFGNKMGKSKTGGNKQGFVLYMLFPLLSENIIRTTTDQPAVV